MADHPEADHSSHAVRVLRAPALLGVALALFLVVRSLEPSLLVRTWLFQGVLSGVAIAVGYGIGALVTRLGSWLARRSGWGTSPFPEHVDVRLRLALLAAGVVVLVRALVRARDDHRWTWERLGYEERSHLVVFGASIAATVVVATLLFAGAWALRRVQAWLTRVGRRWLPAWIAGTVAFAVVTYGLVISLSDYALDRTLAGFNDAFSLADRDLDGEPDPPDSRVRSGGPDSELDWAEMGGQGRRFLVRGPDPDLLADFAGGGPVREPIRVFVGRAASDDPEKRVELAVDELERFGGFQRKAILVVVPTGTGWINEQIVQPVEYFHSGDAATVAVQYSHLPSPLAFLAETDAAGDTGRALVHAVRDRISELPEAERPALLVAGESLGSFGGSQAFDSLDDLVASTDGSLWVGPPETMHLRREAERVRRAGSPQVRPVVDDRIVFANRNDDLAGTRPHTVFLQQPDDPIVWWDWETAVQEPDWLQEPLDPTVNPAMRWAPLTTFLGLAIDMAVSNDFDEGQGHLYGTQPLTSWHAILRPPDWDQDEVQRLRERLSALSR